MRHVIVIGAGASGLMAAAAAGEAGAKVTVFEKNEKAGKKIYITGKGRCNLTNDCPVEEFFDHVVSNPKFLYSAVYGFDAASVKDFMEQNGCPVKTERGARVFPVSDHASDVTKALVQGVLRTGGKIRYKEKVKDIIIEEGHVSGVLLEGGEKVLSDAVIVCTGGLSYPSTGSTGDGYCFAKKALHTIKETEPSLISFRTLEKWPTLLQGLSLKNISVRVFSAEDEKREGGKKKKRPLYEGFGEMLFTHNGVSGPLVLSASTRCSFKKNPEGYRLLLNLKPAIPENELEDRIKRLLSEAPDKKVMHALASLFPSRLTETVISLSGIGSDRTAKSVNDAEIRNLVQLIQAVPMTICGGGGFEEAVITRGGVNVKEIDPGTMESKLVRGLYFAGEVIDVDAVTGGFNLQIAWSTGHLAGLSAAEG